MASKTRFLFTEPRAELREAEAAADDCLQFCLRRLSLREPPLPLPVENWVEHPLGFDFGFEDIPSRESGFETLGYAYPGEKYIRINERFATCERSVRWTIAHEIGHEWLHARPSFPRLSVSKADVAWRYKETWERQADRFAGSLLMPPKLVVRQLFRISSDAGLQPEDAIIELMSDTCRATWLWTETFIPALARAFGISECHAFARLLDLRLFDGAPLVLVKHANRLGLLP
jgi:Zn-dependent peptidase ImmA (M78 family)